MHLCFIVECMTCGLHLSVFKLGLPPEMDWSQKNLVKSEWCAAWT